jgi:calcium-dependent protein kinase
MGIFNNLKSFRAGQHLQKATLTFIATQLSTKAEREEMMSIFQALDTDNSGTVSREEMIEGYQLIFGSA